MPEEYWNLTARLAGPVPPEFDASCLEEGRREASRSATRPSRRPVLADLERAPLGRRVGRATRANASERRRRPSSPASCSRSGRASSGQEDDDDRAAALRGRRAAGRRAGRPHHLHAHRLAARGRTGAERVRELIGAPYGAEYAARRSRTSTRPKPTRRTRTRRSGRRRCDHPPERCARRLTPRSATRSTRLIWNRFVASQMRPARSTKRRVDVDGRGLPVPRARAPCRSSPGWMARLQRGAATSRPRPRPAEDDEAEASGLPPLAEGERLDLRRLEPEAEVHAAAAALHRGDAREGAGGERHRPAEHLRLDHRRASRSASTSTRIEGRFADRCSAMTRQRPARQGVRRHPRRRVHRAAGGGARQDRGGRPQLRRRRSRVLQEVQEGPASTPAGRCTTSRKGKPDRRDVRQVRRADGHQVGQVRPVPRVQRYPECENTREARDSAEARSAERGDRTARTAASRWSSSAAASASSSPAPAIPSARTSRRSRSASRAPRRAAVGSWSRTARSGVERTSGARSSRTCRFVVWQRPVATPCPKCGMPFLTQRGGRGKRWVACAREGCDYRRDAEIA